MRVAEQRRLFGDRRWNRCSHPPSADVWPEESLSESACMVAGSRRVCVCVCGREDEDWQRRVAGTEEAISRNTASRKSVIRDAKGKLHLFHRRPNGATRRGGPSRRQYPLTNAIRDDFRGPCVEASHP